MLIFEEESKILEGANAQGSNGGITDLDTMNPEAFILIFAAYMDRERVSYSGSGCR